MAGITYKDKIVFRCGMCHTSSWGKVDRFLWEGYITNQELYICTKCAQRETGKKSWNKLKDKIKGD